MGSGFHADSELVQAGSQDQRAIVVDAAPTALNRVAIGNRKSGDTNGHLPIDLENATGLIAIDGQKIGPGSIDCNVLA